MIYFVDMARSYGSVELTMALPRKFSDFFFLNSSSQWYKRKAHVFLPLCYANVLCSISGNIDENMCSMC